MDFLTKARLHRAMAAFWSARRFVGEGAAAFEAIARDVVGGRLQGPGVESARHAVGTIGATVDQGLKMHSGDGAVLLDTGLEFHQHGVAAPVTIKHLLAREA